MVSKPGSALICWFLLSVLTLIKVRIKVFVRKDLGYSYRRPLEIVLGDFTSGYLWICSSLGTLIEIRVRVDLGILEIQDFWLILDLITSYFEFLIFGIFDIGGSWRLLIQLRLDTVLIITSTKKDLGFLWLKASGVVSWEISLSSKDLGLSEFEGSWCLYISFNLKVWIIETQKGFSILRLPLWFLLPIALWGYSFSIIDYLEIV